MEVGEEAGMNAWAVVQIPPGLCLSASGRWPAHRCGGGDRFESYKGLEVSEGRRVSMLHGTWHIFLDHPVLGTGLGTLQQIYPRYETVYDGLLVNHTHNDYAEALAETGVIGGICFASFLIVLFWNGWKILAADSDARNLAYHAGALIACLGLLVHAFVDFNFHIPSNALLFLLKAALATSVLPISERGR